MRPIVCNICRENLSVCISVYSLIIMITCIFKMPVVHLACSIMKAVRFVTFLVHQNADDIWIQVMRIITYVPNTGSALDCKKAYRQKKVSMGFILQGFRFLEPAKI